MWFSHYLLAQYFLLMDLYFIKIKISRIHGYGYDNENICMWIININVERYSTRLFYDYKIF